MSQQTCIAEKVPSSQVEKMKSLNDIDWIERKQLELGRKSRLVTMKKSGLKLNSNFFNPEISDLT